MLGDHEEAGHQELAGELYHGLGLVFPLVVDELVSNEDPQGGVYLYVLLLCKLGLLSDVDPPDSSPLYVAELVGQDVEEGSYVVAIAAVGGVEVDEGYPVLVPDCLQLALLQLLRMLVLVVFG